MFDSQRQERIPESASVSVIQLRHLHLALEEKLEELSSDAEPRVVNRQVHVKLPIAQLLSEARARRRRREIKFQHLGQERMGIASARLPRFPACHLMWQRELHSVCALQAHMQRLFWVLGK